MAGQSLGLIETVGLATAVEAADAAVKSANVQLAGYEYTKGGGMITVKLTGEIGAINAAVAAGVAAANNVGKVYAYKIIARTAEGLDPLINATERPAKEAEPEVIAKEDDKATATQAVIETKDITDTNVKTEEPSPATPSAAEKAAPKPQTSRARRQAGNKN